MSRQSGGKRFNVDVGRWYQAIIGDQEELIKIIKFGPSWCIVTYYRGIVLFAGTLMECKKYIVENARC